jgi:hypothetical protein
MPLRRRLPARKNRRRANATLALLSLDCISLTACSAGGAPSFTLFGAFFPAWLLYGLLGSPARAPCALPLSLQGFPTLFRVSFSLLGGWRYCRDAHLAHLVRRVIMEAAGKSHFTSRGRLIAFAIVVLALAPALYALHESAVRPTSSDSSIDADVVAWWPSQ